jgi:hypothetical protein
MDPIHIAVMERQKQQQQEQSIMTTQQKPKSPRAALRKLSKRVNKLLSTPEETPIKLISFSRADKLFS